MRGLDAHQENTGHPHLLSGGINHSRKRATGSNSLTGVDAALWFGEIQIGTPPKKFSGMYGLFCLVIKAAV